MIGFLRGLLLRLFARDNGEMHHQARGPVMLPSSIAQAFPPLPADVVPEIDEDMRFPHAYDYMILRERPGVAALTYYYPGARTDGGQDGLLIRFIPPGARAWIGVFAFGWHGKSGIYTHPDAGCVCVVSCGVGYIVRVDEPAHWSTVAALPITNVVAIVDRGLLVFATMVALIAYDAQGPVWQTERLALDEVRIIGVESDEIVVSANRIDGQDVIATIDARTGKADNLHPW